MGLSLALKKILEDDSFHGMEKVSRPSPALLSFFPGEAGDAASWERNAEPIRRSFELKPR
jgi:hypothetical protein